MDGEEEKQESSRNSASLRRYGDELLIRMDERMIALQREMRGIKEELVSKSDFNNIKAIVYGLVGLIMTLVITAMVVSQLAK